MPEAQKRGSSAAPGISLRNSGANSPNTVEQCTPTFSNTRPRISDITPPPPGCPEWSVRLQGVRAKRPGARSAKRRVRRQRVLDRFERRADVVAQTLEPGARVRFASVEGLGCGQGAHRMLSLANSEAPRLPQRFAGNHRHRHRHIERA